MWVDDMEILRMDGKMKQIVATIIIKKTKIQNKP